MCIQTLVLKSEDTALITNSIIRVHGLTLLCQQVAVI